MEKSVFTHHVEILFDDGICYRDAGQVRKSLSIKPHTDGYFISLSRLFFYSMRMNMVLISLSM